MKKLVAAAVVLVALLAVGCTGGNGVIGSSNLDLLNGNPGSSPPPTPSSSTALFRLSTGQLPYPTDLYFAGSTDGTLNIQPPNALWPNQPFVNALDGFSTNAVIREQFGGALDPTSFTASSIIIVPVVTDNLTKATTGFLGGTPAPLTPGTDYTAALATDVGVGPQILEITPLHPLLPSTCISNGQFLGAKCKTGTGYLVILTNAIKDASGHAAVPDTDYASIKAALAGGPTCPSITDQTLNGVCQLTGAHLQLAQALGVNPANVVLTFSFTTEATVDTLELMSATADPTKQTIKVNPTGISTHVVNPQLPGHADVYVGALTIPYYLSAAAPLTASWQAPAFQMSIERTFDLDLNTNLGNTVIPGSPPDGVTDPSGSHAINLTSPLVTRDSLREGVIDLVMLSRLLPSLSLGAAGTINANGIHYLGHSLGAIEGTVFMAVVGPGVSTATLANPGGELPRILITSPSFAPEINAGLLAQGLLPGTTLYADFWRDIQSLWDAGDPVNYIALATAAHPIHLLQVVGSTPPPAGCNPVTSANGCPDHVVPNATTQAIITASAYGPAGAAGALTRIAAGQAPVVANPGGIHGYVNFIQGDHGSIIDGVVLPVTQEMQTEAISFTGAPIPPAGIPANTPGTALLIANPAVIQP